jgi:hypothetical protein
VLEANTSLHLGHWLTGGSRAATSALGVVTTQSTRQARRADLGGPSHIGRGLGHPQQAASAFWPMKCGRPAALERCGFGPDRAHYCSSFSIFEIINSFNIPEIYPNLKNQWKIE